jgi:putative hydrolase of the HAD superfamily
MELIRAIIFDLGGVLLKGKTMAFIKNGEKILGVRARQGTEACFDRKLNLGTSSHRAAFERVFGRSLFDDEFIQLMKTWINNWQLDEEMLAFAKQLKKKYALAVLSNSEQTFEEKYDGFLRKAFPYIFYSHKLRMAKPEKAIFEHALRTMGIKAEECIMVDDAKENEFPCRQLGIHFILFKDIEQLQKQLEAFGIRLPKAQKKAIEVKIRAIEPRQK